MVDLRWGHRIPSLLRPQFQNLMRLLDKPYAAHKEVYRLKKIRKKAIKARQRAELELSSHL